MAETHDERPLAKALDVSAKKCCYRSRDVNLWWRAELDLNSGKSLDHEHRAGAERAGP